MFKKTKVIALIPAKHKSYNLPKKNYLKLNNLSLFEIAIKSAQHSKFVDQIYVTSDSSSILARSKKRGSNIIKRDKSLCQKNSPADKVILHSIKLIKKKIAEDFILLYLKPTSPFRNHKHINKAFNILKSSNLDSVISVTKQKKTIFKSLTIKKGLIKPVFKESFVTANRQELEDTYIPNGAIYIFHSNAFIKNKKIKVKDALAYEMSADSSHDIDNTSDYNFAKKEYNKFLIYK